MNSPAYMPFFPADYLAKTGHLSPAQHGAYLLLLLQYWTKGSLPTDERVLARIVRMSDREWKANRDTLADFFEEGWKHARVEKELEKARTKSASRAESGARGGNAKSLNIKMSHITNATILPEQNPSKTLPSSSDSDLERKKEVEKKVTRAAPASPNLEFDSWWAIFPNKVGKDVALIAFVKARKKTDLETLVTGVRNYVASKPAWKDWCNPATWLNQGRWKDEPAVIEPRANVSNGSGSAADQVLSIVRRRVAEVNPARWPPSQGGFDLDGNASANDLGGGSAIIDHDGQKARCGVDDDRVSPLFFPSPSRSFGSH